MRRRAAAEEETMTDLSVRPDASGEEVSAGWEPLAGGRRGSRLARFLDPSSPALIYLGVLVVIAGFTMLAIGWSSVAGEVDVWRQMPYVLSAGLPGVGLVMTGLVLVNVAVRRQDGANRRRENAMVAEALHKLQQSLDQR
jgi:hypothetical protein